MLAKHRFNFGVKNEVDGKRIRQVKIPCLQKIDVVLGQKGAYDTSIIHSSRARCDAGCRTHFLIAQIILCALPNNGISGHPHNHPIVSRQFYGLLSWNMAHHLVLTLGNKESWEKAKKAGWFLHFGEYCN